MIRRGNPLPRRVTANGSFIALDIPFMRKIKGNDANFDILEAQDNRQLMRDTSFSIEPGVYLKGQFGVRSEVNAYLDESKGVVTGKPIQTHVTPILSL